MKSCKKCWLICGLFGFFGAGIFIASMFGIDEFLAWKKHHIVVSIKRFDVIETNHGYNNIAFALQDFNIYNDMLDASGRRCLELLSVQFVERSGSVVSVETDISNSYLYFDLKMDKVIGNVR